MKIKIFLFARGPLNTNQESVTTEAEEKLGPIEKNDLTLGSEHDSISYPCAELVTLTGTPELLRTLCDYYIPAYAAAGGLTFVLGQISLEVWNGLPGDVAIDQKTGRGVREDSRGQMFFVVEDLDVEQMAAILTALKIQFAKPARVGEALVFFRRK